ncbi:MULTISPECIES: ammonium transporter [Paracoccus]|uniref:Ammonium transporter n=1 Tax=Paracoccus versutus TaxID=34007 RepID=A0A3D9XG46_PARVE|nr:MULTISPECIES: ammonium transporter [Paracoccus]REF69486.1 ammonium transporter [Paracoccus versutus]WGR58129.1 ammonium transporter [Paracoccus versutus]
MTQKNALVAALPAILFPALAWGQDAEPALSAGDTAFVATCALFVMLMMLPGLALFYAGMARSKNVLSVLTQIFASVALICVLWIAFGYSLSFDTETPLNAVIGGTSKFFLSGITTESMVGTLPEYLFVLFMMMFAAITPPLIVGAFAERMKFAAVLIFMGVWLLINYAPMAHMAWGGGWVFDVGVLDFAGGNVVHLNAGIAALVCALVLGPRKGYGTTMMVPHNMTMTYTGGAMLWVGWLAFCGGCALAANGFSALVMLNTMLGGAGGALGWMTAEWIHRKRPSTFGLASGAIAGLVAITPACGFVGPMGAVLVGFLTAPVCVYAVEVVKRRVGYDDSFDVFGVHGVGAVVGGVLTVVFAAPALGGLGYPEGRTMLTQMVPQVLIMGFSIAVSLVTTWIALKIAGALVGLRVDEEAEAEGLDIHQHGEVGYRLGDGVYGGAALVPAQAAHGLGSPVQVANQRG